tara:strand:- start:3891 stop:4082 length:192 start_codon:yes stop_codon:yes gene_type:complete
MKKVFEKEFEENIFEKELEREMNWLGTAIIVFVLSFIFLLSFAILVIANSILADVEILQFINK